MRSLILFAALVACLLSVAPATALERVAFDAFDADAQPIDLFADGSTSQANSSSVPIVKTSATVPPVPAVEASVPNLNEAFRRLKAAGYVWKELEACELCDTCPAGFKYTGETFFVAEKSETPAVAAIGTRTPTAATCPCIAADGTCPCLENGGTCLCGTAAKAAPVSAPVRTYTEPSCGSESYTTSSYEANCGSEGYASVYSAPVYRSSASPVRGLFSRFFSRVRPAPAAAYSSGYDVVPRYSSYGACASGNCGY